MTDVVVEIVESQVVEVLQAEGPRGIQGVQGGQGPAGASGITGAQGGSGVVAVVAPLTNSGTSSSATLGLNQSALTLATSQVTGLDAGLADKAQALAVAKADLFSDTVVHAFPRTVFANYGGSRVTSTAAGFMMVTLFTPAVDTTVSYISARTSDGTQVTSPTICRMGLYSFDETTLTLIARADNDITLFAANNTIYERAFSATDGYPTTVTLTAGERYGIGVFIKGATVNALGGININDGSLAPVPSVRVSGLTDMPTSASSFTYPSAMLWGRLRA